MEPNLLVFGRPTPPPAPIDLTAGPLTMVFHPDSGALRYFELPDGSEAVRAIYPTLRRPDWSTIDPEVGNVSVETRSDGFSVRCQLTYEVGYRAEIRIEAQGEVVEFAYEGVAEKAFETARTGLCILHPTWLADQPVEIRHPDGTRESGRFPDLVQQDWPFREIVGISTKLPGFKVEIAMEGETFEMEDQRNFGDASYKTYCRPQSLPMRYTIAEGERVKQTVRVTTKPWGSKAEPLPALPKGASGFLLLDETAPLPLLGVFVNGDADPAQVASAPVDFIRMRAEDARDFGKPMEIAFDVSDDEKEFDAERVARIKELQSPVERILIPLKGAKHFKQATESFEDEIVLVSSDEFIDLNRSPLDKEAADGLGFGWHPQHHLTDDQTLFENVESLPDLAATIAERTEGPIVVGPLDIAGGPDDRRGTLLEGAWLVAALGTLVHADVDAATLMNLNDLWRDGKPTPAYHVLADVHEFAEGELIPGAGTSRRAAGFALVMEDRFRAIIANLTPEPLLLTTIAAGDEPHQVRILDGRNLEGVQNDPEAWRAELGEAHEPEDSTIEFELGPYGIARIDAVVEALPEE